MPFIKIDDPLAIKQIDTEAMLEKISAMPGDLKAAFLEASKKQISLPKIDSVLFFGLGGSAIAGELISQELFSQSSVPVSSIKRSSLPSFACENTLCFAVSYSGNTRETVSCYKEAIGKNAQVIAITSGGQLAKLSAKNRNTVINLPAGYQPRAALGLLVGAALGCLNTANLIAQDISKLVNSTAKSLSLIKKDYEPDVPTTNNLAKKIASEFFEQLPLIYASERLGLATALRWKNQLNENAKAMAFANEFPDLSHNEIMASNNKTKPVIVYLKDPSEKADQRINDSITLNLIEPATKKIIEIACRGDSLLEKMLSVILLGDFVSTYLAILKNINPTPVSTIKLLKNEVAKKTSGKKAGLDEISKSKIK